MKKWDLALKKTKNGTDHQDTLLEPITYLVNFSIRSNIFPQCLKTAVVIPIHKSGEIDTPHNYRPIAILPAVSKILEKAVADQLVEHLESNQLLHPQQFGFRQKYSTETANCFLLEKIKNCQDKRSSCWCNIFRPQKGL